MRKKAASIVRNGRFTRLRAKTAVSVFALCLFSALCLTGCGRSPQPKYYLLGEAQRTIPPQQEEEGRGVSLRRVSLPAYLDKETLVVRREGAVELRMEEYRLWAEPLSKTVPRLLEEMMAPALQQEGLALLWSDSAAQAFLSVDVVVLRFDAEPGRSAVLSARWRVSDQDGKFLVQGVFDKARDAGGDYEDMVRNMGLLVEDLGRELAKAACGAHERGRPIWEKGVKKQEVFSVANLK